MKHWKEAAKALESGIPDEQLDRIAPTLEALEAAFRPLVEAIPEDTEPAPGFAPEDGGGE